MYPQDSQSVDKKPLSAEQELVFVKEEARTYAHILKDVAAWNHVFDFTVRKGLGTVWTTDNPDYAPGGGIPQGTTFRGVFAASPTGSIQSGNAGWMDAAGNVTETPLTTLFWNPTGGYYDFVVVTAPQPPGSPNWASLFFNFIGVPGSLPVTIALRLDENA